MAIAFPRSLRALNNDRFRPSRTALIIATILLLVWMGWFFFGQIPLTETSTELSLEREGILSATFPGAAIDKMQVEQPASVRVDEQGKSSRMLNGRVYRVEPAHGQATSTVSIYFDAPPTLPAKIQGQVQVQVDTISPAALILQAIHLPGQSEPAPTSTPTP